MASSFKDQLLGLGFKTSPKPERAAKPVSTPPATRAHKPPHPAKQADGDRKAPPKSQQEIDLAKAFALRNQQEKREREAAEREKQEASRQKKLAKESVAKLLEDKVLNVPDADIARHFSYGGKIKRLYVTPEQLSALNACELGIVQFNGRYCLVSKDITLAVRALLPALVALYCDGDEEGLPEGYDDPRFQIPDDLIW
ncbi:MAG: DUF2058 family protein [Arenimonas sp.]|nr:DUF2058 family protein [Arenimonas sp.]MBP7917549.1 DUF2058 family protein [Arenimonas sp.]